MLDPRGQGTGLASDMDLRVLPHWGADKVGLLSPAPPGSEGHVVPGCVILEL